MSRATKTESLRAMTARMRRGGAVMHPVHIVPVVSWMTTDGAVHKNEGAATWHQERLDRTNAANEMLDAGCNLLEILEALDGVTWPGHDDRNLLSQITKRTKFSIPHWQCRDEAGYRIVRFTDRGMFVHGDAGSWSGPYGSNVNVRDLLDYARGTMRRNGGILPAVQP